MAANLQRRISQHFSDENRKIIEIVNNFKNKSNPINPMNFIEETNESILKPSTNNTIKSIKSTIEQQKFHKIVFNKYSLKSALLADDYNDNNTLNINNNKKTKSETTINQLENYNQIKERRNDLDLDISKAKYYKTMKFIEKASEPKKKKPKPEFYTCVKVDDEVTRKLKKNKSQERLQDFRRKFKIPIRESILLPEININKSKEPEENNDYIVNDALKEIVVKNIKLPRNKSMTMDFANLKVLNYDMGSVDKAKEQKKMSEIYTQYKIKKKERQNDISKEKDRDLSIEKESIKNKSTVSLNQKSEFDKINNMVNEIGVGEILSFPKLQDRNNIKILQFLNSKFEFFKNNNQGITNLSLEYANYVNKAEFPVKEIFYIDELKEKKLVSKR